MNLARYRIHDWPLPDLVAFNRRVHARVDPWWESATVRRATWTGLGLFTLFAAVWIYFATGLPTLADAARLPAAAAEQRPRL